MDNETFFHHEEKSISVSNKLLKCLQSPFLKEQFRNDSVLPHELFVKQANNVVCLSRVAVVVNTAPPADQGLFTGSSVVSNLQQMFHRK